jgi:hypothetical protein
MRALLIRFLREIAALLGLTLAEARDLCMSILVELDEVHGKDDDLARSS